MAAPPMDPRGKSKYECRTRERGSVRGGTCLRRSRAPAGTSLPLRLAAQRSVQPGPFEQPLDRSVERFLLNIFIFIAILGTVLRPVSASCQRRQLWSCFCQLFWLAFYLAAEHARKQEVVAVTGRKLRIWNTLLTQLTFLRRALSLI